MKNHPRINAAAISFFNWFTRDPDLALAVSNEVSSISTPIATSQNRPGQTIRDSRELGRGYVCCRIKNRLDVLSVRW